MHWDQSAHTSKPQASFEHPVMPRTNSAVWSGAPASRDLIWEEGPYRPRMASGLIGQRILVSQVLSAWSR